MAAKKKTTSTEKKSPVKKRPKPVVEVVEEEVVEESPSEATNKTAGKVSIEPDFSSDDSDSETEVVEEEVVEEEPQEEETVEEVVEEVVEEPEEEQVETEEVVEVVEEESEPEPQEVVEIVEEEPEPPVTDTQKPQAKSSQMKKPSTTSAGHKMSIRTILLITIISALVAAFVSGGVYVYLTGVSSLKKDAEELDAQQDSQATESHSMEETPDESDTETDSETKDTSDEVATEDYSVSVLNGSGQIGAAGDAADVAEGVGFVIDDTGNADSYDYEDTVVQFKDSVSKAAQDLLVEALEDADYSVEVGDELDDDSEFDVVIIVGSN